MQATTAVADGFGIDTSTSDSIVNGLQKVEVEQLHKKAVEIQNTVCLLKLL